MALKGMVKGRGVNADESLSGMEAIKLIQQRVQNKQAMYKLIMLDYSMPGKDGPQTSIAIRELCKGAGFDRPYICCVTAYSEAQYKRRALEAGMDKFMVKPLLPK